jgi:hypothetical protein
VVTRRFVPGSARLRPSLLPPLSVMPELGKLLVALGIVIAVVGLLLWTGWMPRWLGRLPGDIRIERNGAGFYFPIVSCVLISIILTLILSIFRR